MDFNLPNGAEATCSFIQHPELPCRKGAHIFERSVPSHWAVLICSIPRGLKLPVEQALSWAI
jgi:hypothetical protein